MSMDERSTHHTKTTTMDNFEVIKILGNGSYGTVYHARKKDSNEEFALKELSK